MKCPRQQAFAKKLDELLYLSRDIGRDHFSYDELARKEDHLHELRAIFVNNWCPILKEYEPC